MFEDVTRVTGEGKPDKLARVFDRLGIALRYKSKRGRLCDDLFACG